jgi:glycerol-3-phosphate acyltransferase PlsY
VMRLVVAIVLGYMLGSIPTGLWLGHLVAGVDVRSTGSRRTGATNVQRSLGTRAGIAVLVLDCLKGALAVSLLRLLTGDDYVAAVAGVAAVVGHVWPVLAGFRGGRGVATAGGALLALSPLALLGTFAILALVVYLTRYVSLGSVTAGLLSAVLAVLLRHAPGGTDAAIVSAALGGSLVVARHADNIQRLLHGGERRLGSRDPVEPA